MAEAWADHPAAKRPEYQTQPTAPQWLIVTGEEWQRKIIYQTCMRWYCSVSGRVDNGSLGIIF